MPRRSILSVATRNRILAIAESREDLIRYYTFNESDLAHIRQHRGASNRLGFAVQLCYMRYPGVTFGAGETPPRSLLQFVAKQIKVSIRVWASYAKRDQTRREHISELQTIYGFKTFSSLHYRSAVRSLDDLAWQTEKGDLLAVALVENLRQQTTLLPTVAVVERICAEAITCANRKICRSINESLSDEHRKKLDNLFSCMPNVRTTWLTWVRQEPGKSNSQQMLRHIERLKVLQSIELPNGIERRIHRNRLLKMAREATRMTPQALAKLENSRRYATLVAMTVERTATVTDEIIDLHARIIGNLLNTARNKHQKKFQQSGREINEKVRLYSKIGQALLTARQCGSDPFKAIESIVSWDRFEQSITEAEELAQPNTFDYLHRLGKTTTLRRYIIQFMNVLELHAAPSAQDLLKALEVIHTLSVDGTRLVPADAPTGFIRKRWKPLIFTDTGIDRRYYELCAFAELRNALRSGDIWVKGSRQFKDFEEYLVPTDTFMEHRKNRTLPLAVSTNCDQYLSERHQLLENQLQTVNSLADSNMLPDAVITDSGLKITPLDAAPSEAAQVLINYASQLLPRIKITALLVEVDQWTGFTQLFTHIKNGTVVKDKTLLLTAILADAINMGLTKMAESCPDTTYARLSWMHAWHIRDETYSSALAELVNTQSHHPFASNWGDGTTSSSDGQRFPVGGLAESTGHINLKYGLRPGRLFYTHVSDQYAPFSTRVINANVRDATFVLDGLLYHESDLCIEEHYTDTAGFTDHVFGLMHLLGFRFAPRIRDLGNMRLYSMAADVHSYPALTAIMGGLVNIKCIRKHWDEILRLATSIRQGTVTASLMLRKLGGYPRQNGLALALRELGRIERTLFILDWLQNVELRRRVQIGLNKGEARNSLARAVFFNRLGELRDRKFDQQCYRASGLNLVVAAIVLWNTVYMERAVQAMKDSGFQVDDSLLQHLSPLGWRHINLTGDYVWKVNKNIKCGQFRPLNLNESSENEIIYE